MELIIIIIIFDVGEVISMHVILCSDVRDSVDFVIREVKI